MMISKLGAYSNIPIEAYHRDPDLCPGPSISSSGLRTISAKSAAHYWAGSKYNPERIETKETEAFITGRGAHHLLLGEDDFSTLFVMRPDRFDSWRTNEAKAWRAKQEADGRTVLLPSQIETIRGMAKSLSHNALIGAGLLNGAVEQTLAWPDKETGVWCLSRPDCIPNDSGDVADLKSTTDVGYDELSRTIGEFSYHQQGALVGEAFKNVLGRPMTSFSLCMVEKTPPFCARVVTLKDCDLERGAKQNRAALRIFAECMERGVWPGPGDHNDAEFIELPAWLQGRIDKQLEYAGVK